MNSHHLLYADEAIEKAISNKEIPGAVLAVVRHGKMAYLKAYGNRQVYPTVEPMDVNTVFDMASCSKSMSTAVCAMMLIERGQLRLMDRVSLYIPGFKGWEGANGEKENIRIVDIMTHTSGLPPYAPVDELTPKYGSPNPAGLMEYISTCKRDFKPQTDFQYSCLNYITLQHVIETISGQSLRDFAQANIFTPLGMKHTDYLPTTQKNGRWTTTVPCPWIDQIAPTEKQKDGSVLRGQVHDPLARIMNGGISGNAGVFSNANDIAVLTAMLLNNGDLFGPNTYGHTGYTGTSIIIDPDNDTSVILLTNRAHPEDKGEVVRLHQILPGHPEKLFLMIGINDVSHNLPADSVVALVTKVIDKIQTESPGTKLCLQSLLPINESVCTYKTMVGKTAIVPEINGKLEAIACERKIPFINLFPLFTEKGTNVLRKELTSDGLHLTTEGYTIWGKALKRYLP